MGSFSHLCKALRENSTQSWYLQEAENIKELNKELRLMLRLFIFSYYLFYFIFSLIGAIAQNIFASQRYFEQI